MDSNGIDPIRAYYAELNPNKILLPPHLKFLHFRIFAPGPIKIKWKIRTLNDVRDMLIHYAPLHAFYSTSYFLNPTKVGRKGSDGAIFLFSDEFVVDVDRENLEEAKEDTLKLIEAIREINLTIKYVVFSGHKGFHIHCKMPSLSNIEDATLSMKKSLVDKLNAKTEELFGHVIPIDEAVSYDTRRIMRIPGTIHGETGNIVEKVDPQKIKSYHPVKAVDIQNYILEYGTAQQIEQKTLGVKL